MRIERRVADGVTILSFAGEWDSFNLEEVSGRVEGLIRGRPARLVFNMKDLSFATSSPLGYLIEVHQRMRTKQGGLVLSEPSDFLRATIRSLGLQHFFRLCDTDVEAVRSLAESTEER